MKTKILLSLITVVLITSCVKDFYGHPDDDKGILTEKNYVYADDLKRVHLESVVAELKISLEKTDPIKEEEQYNKLSNQLGETLNTIIEIDNLRNEVFKGKQPPPPCPTPQNCLDWLGVQYFTGIPNQSQLQMIIYDSDQNVVAQTDGKFEKLDGLDVPLEYSVMLIKNEDYRGEIQIQIVEKIGDKAYSFTVKSEIQ